MARNFKSRKHGTPRVLVLYAGCNPNAIAAGSSTALQHLTQRSVSASSFPSERHHHPVHPMVFSQNLPSPAIIPPMSAPPFMVRRCIRLACIPSILYKIIRKYVALDCKRRWSGDRTLLTFVKLRVTEKSLKPCYCVTELCVRMLSTLLRDCGPKSFEL